MDTRGQGSAWSVGDTPDPGAAGAPFHPGFMTQGILDPATYYYRRVFTDAVRAVEAVRTMDAVDPSRVVVTGGSQGGGISLAVAGLVPGLAGVMPDVPFLTDFPRAITLRRHQPVRRDRAVSEGASRPRRPGPRDPGVLRHGQPCPARTAPALFSVGLMDVICPPSTVYAAYNHYGGPKEIREYPFNDHEGGQGFHEVAKMGWLRERIGG